MRLTAERSRRDVVRSVAAAAAVAGCLGDEDEASDGLSIAESTEFGRHPATNDIRDQPVLGDPGASARIIAFEDPSCPSCRQFERQTLPRLSDHADDGELAFSFRGYPVVQPWGRPATAYLEAVYDRAGDAFWDLKDHYFDEQRSIDADNVHETTRRYLGESTDLDADDLVASVRGGAYDDPVDLDLEAGRQAGVDGTPTFFLFLDHAEVTTLVGPQGYDVFAAALDLSG